MAERCITCGASSELVRLDERGFGPAHEGLTVALCRGCLEAREARSWEPGDEGTQTLLDALEPRHAPPLARFTYLEDREGAVHLLRLRPGFVDDRAVGQALGER